ncbi:unnamed protein product, partial [Brassica oleracea]
MEENDDTRRPLCLLPERIFAVGEEPAGVRVTPYHKAGAIRQILAAWFLFAGKPIRFSIREFAMLTGLNCSKFPRRIKKKSKNFMTEKPYWSELFGSLKEVPVSSVLRMLEKKTVVDKDIRLKYAYLSLLASVILPTTHTPRISKECTEKIKDLDA